MEGDRESPSTFEPTLLNFKPQSPFIDACKRFAHGFPPFSSTSLVIEDTSPTHLILTPKRYLVHHLEAITRLVTFTLRCVFVPTGQHYSSLKLFMAQMCEGNPT
ncbi:hypothetical protein TNCV_3007741 [Trichonephila clavipes]|nr:hypothetical protein TNCV_3007741 [Trichonephila clavipes]